ncbi:MAG: hypothetical protein BGO94_04415 [Micrococcales bacterium 72-143]|nr:MAG: hypothetical protein BGO94_04415 [Micrococcales bacterium 72-143]
MEVVARTRRERSLTETLLSITLGLEAAMMFFAALVIFGLDRLDPDWLALVYGGAFILVLVLAAGVQRWAWGVWFGAALQLAILATGLLEPMMFLVGAAFLALWVYCFVRGRQIDTQKAAWLAERAASESTTEQGDAP